MKPLVCDICGGQLVMDNSGKFAVCESCGMKYTTESIRARVQEITGTVKIDTTESERKQVENWTKLADAAFNNSNYDEAYNYYCKILEKDVKNWIATFRKGMCLGWRANLQNMRSNEVVGGISDATQILLTDASLSDAEKADGKFLMAKEVFAWIHALSNMVVNHGNEFGFKLTSAAREFYQREQIIAKLFELNLAMVDEHTYINCTNRNELQAFVSSISSVVQQSINNMSTTFRVKTGTKYNTFWEQYDDVFENVTPDYATRTAKSSLEKSLNSFTSAIAAYKAAYNKAQSEKKEKLYQDKIRDFMDGHPDVAVAYSENESNLQNAKDNLARARGQLAAVKQIYLPVYTAWKDYKDIVNSSEKDIIALEEKIIGKKKSAEKIAELKAKITETKEKMAASENDKAEADQRTACCRLTAILAEKCYGDAQRENKAFLAKYNL